MTLVCHHGVDSILNIDDKEHRTIPFENSVHFVPPMKVIVKRSVASKCPSVIALPERAPSNNIGTRH